MSEWIKVLTIIGFNFIFFLWIRNDLKSFSKNFRSEIETDRRKTLQILSYIREEMKGFNAKKIALEFQEANLDAVRNKEIEEWDQFVGDGLKDE